jgi:hypothetical protein
MFSLCTFLYLAKKISFFLFKKNGKFLLVGNKQQLTDIRKNIIFTFQVPGLVAKSALKPSKSGDGERISRNASQRMAEYYHDHLWQGVGELTEQCVLWQVLPGDKKIHNEIE